LKLKKKYPFPIFVVLMDTEFNTVASWSIHKLSDESGVSE